MTADGSQELWCEVLNVAITDALQGVRDRTDKKHRVRDTYEARAYVSKPNRDFNTVCELAGVDPDAMRDRLAVLIADAPTPEDLIMISGRPKSTKKGMTFYREKKRKPTARQSGNARRRPGVVCDFDTSLGTGAGRSAQDSPKIDFSAKQVNPCQQ